jgi:hypothetical protein
MNVNLTKESIKYGIIGGLIICLVHIGSWTMGVATYVSVISIESFVPYLIILFLLAGLQIRKQNGGFLSFKEAIKFVFLAYAIVAAIEAINSYILYNILDKDLTGKVLEITREKMVKMMEKFGATPEQLKENMQKVDAEKKETNLRNILLGTGMYLIWYFVKSMIISIIIKKDPKIDESFLSQ